MYERTCQCDDPDPRSNGVCGNCDKPIDDDESYENDYERRDYA